LKSLKLNIKKIIGVGLVALSLGSSVAVCGGDEDKLDKNKGRKYPSIYLELGPAVDNIRYTDLCRETKCLEELDKEELVSIFEKDLEYIIKRDTKISQEEGNINKIQETLENQFFHYIDFPTENFFINLLWSGSFRIVLNEGIESIETLKNDFKKWPNKKITVEDLIKYFAKKFEYIKNENIENTKIKLIKNDNQYTFVFLYPTVEN